MSDENKIRCIIADCLLSVLIGLAVIGSFSSSGFNAFFVGMVVSWVATMGMGKYAERLVRAIICGVLVLVFFQGMFDFVVFMGACVFPSAFQVWPREMDASPTRGKALYLVLRVLWNIFWMYGAMVTLNAQNESRAVFLAIMVLGSLHTFRLLHYGVRKIHGMRQG